MPPERDAIHAEDRVELHSLQAKPEYNGNLAGRWTSWAGAV